MLPHLAKFVGFCGVVPYSGRRGYISGKAFLNIVHSDTNNETNDRMRMMFKYVHFISKLYKVCIVKAKHILEAFLELSNSVVMFWPMYAS